MTDNDPADLPASIPADRIDPDEHHSLYDFTNDNNT